MTAKSDLLIEELVSACVAFGRGQLPDWQTRIEKARCALKAHVEQLEAELKITDELLKEATETIGAVVACCTYNSNDDAKIGIYGIDQKAFTRIDKFITHYNDAVSAGKVSVDVKTSWKGLEE